MATTTMTQPTPITIPSIVRNERSLLREIAFKPTIAMLPSDQLRVIRMSFFEDRPHGAIAATLGVPLGTVKSRLRLAFRRFRKALGEIE